MLAGGIYGKDKDTYLGEIDQPRTNHASSTPFPIVQAHENVGRIAEIGAGGARAFDRTPLEPPGPRGSGQKASVRRRAPSAHAAFRSVPPYRELRELTLERAVPHPLRRVGGIPLPPAGDAGLPCAEELPIDIRVLTELMSPAEAMQAALRADGTIKVVIES